MKYIVHREMNGKKPERGDWVTLQMVYRDENDSVLLDSRKFGKPLRFALPAPKFAGSFEEGLMQIGEGDSATFFINADSLFEHVISKEQEGKLKSRPRPGSLLKFDVSLIRIQSYQEAEMEIALNESQQERAEMNALEAYLREKNMPAEKEPEGYYLLMKQEGKGTPVRTGDEVSINFKAYFLNGAPFQESPNESQPYHFHAGQNAVIKGLDLAVQKLRSGDEALVILPSSLAYGGDGLKNQDGLNYIVPPFSTLIFEIRVIGTSPVARK